MAKLTLDTIASGYASITKLNTNFDAIETALENTLSRDGTTPNQMETDLDMNGYRILNRGDVDYLEGWIAMGVWAPNTEYAAGSVVNYGSASYIAITDHTSGTDFTSDSAYWQQLFLEGTISANLTGVTQFYYQTAVGDGAETSFNLAAFPATIAHTHVSIDGVVMVPTTEYTLTGTTITFAAAPGNLANILFQYNTGVEASTAILAYTYTATGGETAIALPYQYSPGTNAIAVYQNGLNLYTGTHFTETDSQTVTLTSVAVAGDVFLVRYGLLDSSIEVAVADGAVTANKLASNSVSTVKIVDDAVTFAKLENLATDKLLGRITAGTGDAEEITVNDFTAEATVDSANDYVLFWDFSASAHRKALISNVVGSISSLGVSQSWQNLTSSRSASTSYQNLTGKPIMVNVSYSDGSAIMYVSTDGSTWVTVARFVDGADRGPMSVVVPNTHYYKVTVSGGSVYHWAELR